MSQRTITPSKITAWLDCQHYLTLKHELEAGIRQPTSGGTSAFAKLLMDKGLAHEEACLAAYEAQGKRVLRVPGQARGETFERWTARARPVLSDTRWDVLYQMPLVDRDMRGVADFLLRTMDDDGVTRLEPVDAKLARAEAKPGHVLQLCFYADAIQAATGERPRRMHLWLGSHEAAQDVETLRVEDVSAYWRRLRTQLAEVLAQEAPSDTRPEPCEHCAFCEFSTDCDAQWRGDDSLVFVAGLRRQDRVLLEAEGVPTLASLADRSEPVKGLPIDRQERATTQARLQQEARTTQPATPPWLPVVARDGEKEWGHGFERLPEPAQGDVFLDFEGHPFWTAKEGLFFLFALIQQDADGEWRYHPWWAHTKADEVGQAAALIEHLATRREQFPAMHVYHYNHTERSALQTLVREQGAAEATLADLVGTGAFVDLLPVVRNAVQVGTESYGLKAMEALAGYERTAEVGQGAGAVVEYERYLRDQAADALALIQDYNEDDVRATRALRDWLVEQRPADLPWRPAWQQADEDLPEVDEQVASLHAYGEGTPQHLLGDVLGYWRRERSAVLGPLLELCGRETADLIDRPDVLTGLVPVRSQQLVGPRGGVKRLRTFAFPAQDASELKVGSKALFALRDGPPGYSEVHRLDLAVQEVDLEWSEALDEDGTIPSTVVQDERVRLQPKGEALSALTGKVLNPAVDGQPPRVALALLARELPRFVDGAGPAGGRFRDDLNDMLRWVTRLDETVVAVQGPPGTGKTYRGARQVRALLDAGLRVGITATSHHAIDNLLASVVDLYVEDGRSDELKAVRRGPGTFRDGTSVVKTASNPAAGARPEHRLVTGTPWHFASGAMADNPVDVLVVDEAGQMSLADALAACRSAKNLLLLGDPLQLPQVSQASHPGVSGRSVLQHVLGDDATLTDDRGVFLTETRRMHPDVCGFISAQVYEGRLGTHPDCEQQGTEHGTGLRWLQAHHEHCSTSAPAEVELVHAEAARLLGCDWTDQHGRTAPLTARDILVVAPFNAQRKLLRDRLEADPATAGIAVGTVDSFQGQEAAVVFFSMTTSSAAELSRGADFLFSTHRLNVAVSRARCLAYLVCTEELLNTRGRSLQEMRLLSVLSAFVESADVAHLASLPRQADAPSGGESASSLRTRVSSSPTRR